MPSLTAKAKSVFRTWRLRRFCGERRTSVPLKRRARKLLHYLGPLSPRSVQPDHFRRMEGVGTCGSFVRAVSDRLGWWPVRNPRDRSDRRIGDKSRFAGLDRRGARRIARLRRTIPSRADRRCRYNARGKTQLVVMIRSSFGIGFEHIWEQSYSRALQLRDNGGRGLRCRSVRGHSPSRGKPLHDPSHRRSG